MKFLNPMAIVVASLTCCQIFFRQNSEWPQIRRCPSCSQSVRFAFCFRHCRLEHLDVVRDVLSALGFGFALPLCSLVDVIACTTLRIKHGWCLTTSLAELLVRSL